MEFKKTEEGEATVYRLIGRLDTQSAPEFQDVLEEGFGRGENKLVFDCKDLEYMSSAGLRAILYAKKRIDGEDDGENASSGYLKLVNVSEDILEVFEMTGFVDFLNINEN